MEASILSGLNDS